MSSIEETAAGKPGQAAGGDVTEAMRQNLAKEMAAVFERYQHFGPAEGDLELLMPPINCDLELRNLRANQRQALDALFLGSSYEQAAQRAGVDRRTLYRWLHHDQAFLYALEELRERMANGAFDRLIQGAAVAATTLCEGALSGKVRSAEVLLRFVLELRRSAKSKKPAETPQPARPRSGHAKQEHRPGPRRRPAALAPKPHPYRGAGNVPFLGRSMAGARP